MRLSVRVLAQNAPFRRVRFSLPAQTWSRLTEKRTLLRRPHGKAQCGWAASRKSAFWKVGVTGKRSLRFSDRANCAFPSHCRPRGMGCNHPSGCGAVCSRICKFGFEFDFTKSRSLGAQLGCAVWVRSLGRKPYGKVHPRLGRDTISSPMVIPVRVYEERQEV